MHQKLRSAKLTKSQTTSEFLAPIDFITPISFVLSITDVYIVFAIPIPPITKEIAAIPKRKAVIILRIF